MDKINLSEEVANILDKKYPDRHRTFRIEPRWDEIIMTYFDVIEEKLNE